MIKAIIFDYFGVLCSDQYWRFVKEDKNLRDGFHELANKVNVGELSWNEFIRVLADKTGKSVEEIHEMYKTEQIDPQVLTYAAQLHKNYKTALLTNAHYDFIDPLIEKAHLNEVFDAILISSRVGAIKPEPAIYEEALRQLGVKPEEAVMIDDIQRNVDGAAQVGIKSILYKNFEQLQRDLTEVLARKT